MTIPSELEFKGANKESQFRDKFVMPLLTRLGFSVVLNYHGSREFGRDVIFADIDRFGHIVYCGMQVKYESSISQSGSHKLVEDAVEAMNSPFKHPQTGSKAHILRFYVATSGSITDNAQEHFFNSLAHHRIRDARLLDGNALLLLNRSATFHRTSLYKERVTGVQLEAKRNLVTAIHLLKALESKKVEIGLSLIHRFRTSAVDAFLAAPSPAGKLTVDLLNEYWEFMMICNHLVESVNGALSAERDAEGGLVMLEKLLPDLESRCMKVNNAAIGFLAKLGKEAD